MAKNDKDKSKKPAAKAKDASPEGQDRPSGSSRFIRYCLVLLLLGAAGLCWLSLLTFHPTDWPSRAVYPPEPIHNAAGRVGAFIAFELRYWLGGGAYMGLLFATVVALVMVFGGRVPELIWRLIGVVLLIVATSAAVYCLNPSPARGAAEVLNGSAGILGIAAGSFLLSKFGALGGWLVLLVTFAIGLMLTADNIVLQIPKLGRKAWKHRRQLPAVGGILRLRSSPAAAGESGGSAGAATATRPSARPGASGEGAERVAPPVPKPASPKPSSGPASPDGEDPSAGGPSETAPAAPAKPKPAPTPAKSASGGAGQSPGGGSGSDEPAGPFELPPESLLAPPSSGYLAEQEEAARQRARVLQQTLTDFNVEAEVVGHTTGPVITVYELALSPGVKTSQVANLATDIARSLAVPGVRIVPPRFGKDTVGIEVPNLEKEIVRIRELMDLRPDADGKMALPVYLGKDAAGDALVADLASMPHMLIAGTTGSGKSVCINAIIVALLMKRTPEDVRLILVDPKMVEMAAFENLPHLLCPIVNDMRKAEDILEWAATKMDERYELFKEAGVRNIAGYNRLSETELYKRFNVESDQEKARVPKRIPYYVIIVDELADLIMTSSKEVESHIIRIAQKARAVGIHLILATQRPSVNVVTGLIKSNMPCRISFRVASRQESRIVLDQNGADVLLGQGDMLFLQPGTSNLVRAQGTYLDDSEIQGVVGELRKGGEPQYNAELMKLNSAPVGEDGELEKDELFDKAVEIVLQSQRGSVSLLQRRLQVGYSRASRIIDQMADAGLLGEYRGSQARECTMTLEDWQALKQAEDDDLSGESADDGTPTSC